MKEKKKKTIDDWIMAVLALIFALVSFNLVFIVIKKNNYKLPVDLVIASVLEEDVKDSLHIEKPEFVKGIYLTAYTAGTRRLDDLIDFVKQNDLNAMVIDLKGPNGEPAFHFTNEKLIKYNTDRELYNPKEVLDKLHKAGIYVIGRTFVFQDPYMVRAEPSFALKNINGGNWTDYRGVSWLDPTSLDVWQYNVNMAVDAYEQGFDEIQFDYIRFPSDGNLKAIKYVGWDGTTPKELEIEKFFAYISKILRRKGVKTSADLFGLVCCYNNYDLGIGQVLERALPYFDFISPMMYPSHYSDGFIGYSNPAEHPYGVVKYSMDKANEKVEILQASATSTPLGGLRPWIQDFDLGAYYNTFEVNEQIRAVDEANGEGFLIWNARNVYTPLK